MKLYLTIINFLLITGAAYFGVSLFYQTAASKLIPEHSIITAAGKTQSSDKESRKPLSDYRHIKRTQSIPHKREAGQSKKLKKKSISPN